MSHRRRSPRTRAAPWALAWGAAVVAAGLLLGALLGGHDTHDRSPAWSSTSAPQGPTTYSTPDPPKVAPKPAPSSSPASASSAASRRPSTSSSRPSTRRSSASKPSPSSSASTPKRTTTVTPPTSSQTPPPPKPSPSSTTVFSATSDLHEKINQQRARDGWGRISRYFGMDAFAQEQADAGAPAFRGEYAEVIAVQADDASTAAALVGSQTTGYSKIGIGLHDGYWVVVLNN